MTRFRVYAGLALMAVCIYFAISGFTELARYGSCSSGGVYVSRRECAPGAGWDFLAVFAGILGTLVSIFLTASNRAVQACIGLVFGTFASYFFVTAFGADLTPGGDSVTMPTAIAGTVCTLIALPLLVSAMRTTPPEPADDTAPAGPTIVMAAAGPFGPA